MNAKETEKLWTAVWYLKRNKSAQAIKQIYSMLEHKPAATGGLGDALASIAEKEIGVMEIPRNSNSGKRVKEYQASTWYDGTGWPWCAAFVCFCVRALGELPFKRPETPGAWDFENWAEREKLDIVEDPQRGDLQRGDIVCFNISHIGIVAKVSGGRIETIEGNTDQSGSREGGGVYRGRRKVSDFRSRIRI
tara:strand:+ start:156 stop:731 length:576 start_codon:yes stop_codon:yes gene_type:complete